MDVSLKDGCLPVAVGTSIQDHTHEFSWKKMDLNTRTTRDILNYLQRWERSF